MRERAVLVSIFFGGKKDPEKERLCAGELTELGRSAGLEIAKHLVFHQAVPVAATLIGSGKIATIREAIKTGQADAVIFQPDLSPSQQRNLEESFQAKTLDRTQLILDIFARRAKSMEGKLQIELAQLKYLLPRLSGKGIDLSRLGGGVGTRGPGEQKLEIDRRRIRERVAKLSEDLETLQTRRVAAIQRKKEKEYPLVALVGYTNAGKSTLFNRLSGAQVLSRDQQFSTLDTTTRSFVLAPGQKALLVDTVGFVRDLPHHLIESFKATLEEVVYADALLEVVDASSPGIGDALEAVEMVLKSLDVSEKSVYLVLHKWDLVAADEKPKLQARSWKSFRRVFFVSSLTGEGVDSMIRQLAGDLFQDRIRCLISIPVAQMSLINRLYEEGQIHARSDAYDGVNIEATITPKLFRQLQDLLGPGRLTHSAGRSS